MFVIAGPNGAGKSTVASELLPSRFPSERFLNADDIAKAIATNSPLAAGRIMIRRLCEMATHRETFAFESTLSGRTYARFLKQAKASEYLIHITFLWLSSADLAKHRVAERVEDGGHDVPAADITRRYKRGISNFLGIYKPLANSWVLCENSGDSLAVIARGRTGAEPLIYNEAKYDRIQHAVQP